MHELLILFKSCISHVAFKWYNPFYSIFMHIFVSICNPIHFVLLLCHTLVFVVSWLLTTFFCEKEVLMGRVEKNNPIYSEMHCDLVKQKIEKLSYNCG